MPNFSAWNGKDIFQDMDHQQRCHSISDIDWELMEKESVNEAQAITIYSCKKECRNMLLYKVNLTEQVACCTGMTKGNIKYSTYNVKTSVGFFKVLTIIF